MPDPNIGWYVKCYGRGRWIWGVATDGGKVIGTGIHATKEAAVRAVWSSIEEHFFDPIFEMKGDFQAVKEFLENLPEFGAVTYEPERQESPDDSAGTDDEDVLDERGSGSGEGAGTEG